jgi:hypothetical protein
MVNSHHHVIMCTTHEDRLDFEQLHLRELLARLLLREAAIPLSELPQIDLPTAVPCRNTRVLAFSTFLVLTFVPSLSWQIFRFKA